MLNHNNVRQLNYNVNLTWQDCTTPPGILFPDHLARPVWCPEALIFFVTWGRAYCVKKVTFASRNQASRLQSEIKGCKVSSGRKLSGIPPTWLKIQPLCNLIGALNWRATPPSCYKKTGNTRPKANAAQTNVCVPKPILNKAAWGRSPFPLFDSRITAHSRNEELYWAIPFNKHTPPSEER